VYNFSDKEIVILINSGTASASEILAWTLKDYFPERVTIIWEKSFWKGSVQTQRYYRDGSALKYTIARWYTWKSEKWIDWIGIEPDMPLIFDQALWKEKQIDNQLQEAIK
jgi:carboxyl-terminal processing protease